MAKVGRSLPNLVRLPSHYFRDITKFLSLSDGDDEAPRVLLTGGLLVRIQPEEPLSFGNFTTFALRRSRFVARCPFLALFALGFLGAGGSRRPTSADKKAGERCA